LQYELAISHGRIGEALLRQRDFVAAAKAFERAKGIFLALVTADRSNVSWQYDLAVSHERLADVLIEQGKVDEAVVDFRASLKIRGSLLAANPDSVQRQIEVAWVQRRLALQGDEPAQRWAAIKKMMERLKTMDALSPDQLDWLTEAGEHLGEPQATERVPLSPVVAAPPMMSADPSSPR